MAGCTLSLSCQAACLRYGCWVRTSTHYFIKEKEVTGKRPNTLISDGARNFNDSFNKEFYTNTTPRPRHISHIRLQGDHNNSKMERLNGKVIDREKVMRGL